MTFGEKLLIFRAKYNLSQTAVAKIFGIDQSDISNYELEKRQPNRLNCIRFEQKMETYEKENENV